MALVLSKFGDSLGAVRATLDDPDSFWRLECWMAYSGALVHRHPATVGLADWLGPVLKLHLVTAEDLFLFWTRDVGAEEVPRSHWSGLVAYGQLHGKISHGNPSDQQHAAHALTWDAFVTADRHFVSALETARRYYPRPVAKILYWDRTVGTALQRLANVLRLGEWRHITRA